MGCKILKRVAWPWPCPFQGRFLISRVGLAMINQCSKYEVSRFTRCEAMNSGAKCTNWGSWGRLSVTQGHSGSSAMSPFDRVHTTSYSTLIETMCLSYTFSRCSRLFVESRRFDPPHLHLTPPQGVIPVEFHWDLWHPKTGFPGLSCGVVCVILRLAVLVELRLVTDRRTDTGPRLVPRMHSKLCPPSLSKSSFARSNSSVGTQKWFLSPGSRGRTRRSGGSGWDAPLKLKAILLSYDCPMKSQICYFLRIL